MPKLSKLDAFGEDNFQEIGTAVGHGRGMAESMPAEIDRAFFKSDIMRILFRSQLSTPFDKSNPSKLFVTEPNGVRPKNVANYGPGMQLYKKGLSGIVDMQFQPQAFNKFELKRVSEEPQQPHDLQSDNQLGDLQERLRKSELENRTLLETIRILSRDEE
jgi:hypothetical protein